MNAQQILSQVNTLMTRRGIIMHRIVRELAAGVKANNQEILRMETFVRAASTRAAHLMSQLSGTMETSR